MVSLRCLDRIAIGREPGAELKSPARRTKPPQFLEGRAVPKYHCYGRLVGALPEEGVQATATKKSSQPQITSQNQIAANLFTQRSLLNKNYEVLRVKKLA